MPTKDKDPTPTPKLDLNVPEERAKTAGKKSPNAKRAKKVLEGGTGVKNLTSTSSMTDDAT